MYCAVARALELLGERWTLLVVRELLTGPKRFADVSEGLPGIASTMLSDRLGSLMDAGVVIQRTLPPPARSTVYELTDRGHDLLPVVQSLGTWGLPLLGAPRPDEQFRLAWLLIALSSSYRPRAAPDPVTIVLDVDGEQVTIRAHGERHEVVVGDAPADIRVSSDRDTFLNWMTGRTSHADARAQGMRETPRGALPRLRSMYAG